MEIKLSELYLRVENLLERELTNKEIEYLKYGYINGYADGALDTLEGNLKI